MGRPKPQRLNFPIFSILCHKDVILVSGGAGTEYGIENKLAVYKKGTALKDLVVEVNTKKDLIENLNSNGKVDLISCNSGRFCIIYRLNIAQGKIEEVTRFSTDKDGQNTSVFDSKGTLLATGGEEGIIKVWRLNSKGDSIEAVKEQDLIGHANSINHLNISIDDQLLCSASDDKTCRIFDLKSGSLLKRLTFGEENKSDNLKFACAYFSKNQGHLYTIQNNIRDGPAYFTVWNVEQGFEPEKTIKLHNHAITSSCLNDEGTFMGLGTVDGMSKVLNLEKMDINCKVTAHDLIVKSVSFVDKSRYLVSVSADYSFFFLPNVRSTGFFTWIIRIVMFLLIIAVFGAIFNQKLKLF